MSKNIYFILQQKGGVGKSMLTYLLALKNEANKNVLFVDLDASTRTSAKQLQFLKSTGRLYESSINNSTRKIDRELFFGIVDKTSKIKGFTDFYFDLGAPESEQLPKLFTMDITPENLKEFEETVGAKFHFYVVVAGGGSYVACMEYLVAITEALKDKFSVVACLNQNTFHDNEKLKENVNDVIQKLGISFKEFGDFYTDRSSVINILNNVSAGKGLVDYTGFMEKLTIKKELEKL